LADSEASGEEGSDGGEGDALAGSDVGGAADDFEGLGSSGDGAEGEAIGVGVGSDLEDFGDDDAFVGFLVAFDVFDFGDVEGDLFSEGLGVDVSKIDEVLDPA